MKKRTVVRFKDGEGNTYRSEFILSVPSEKERYETFVAEKKEAGTYLEEFEEDL